MDAFSPKASQPGVRKLGFNRLGEVMLYRDTKSWGE